jgi:hypothetical protein
LVVVLLVQAVVLLLIARLLVVDLLVSVAVRVHQLAVVEPHLVAVVLLVLAVVHPRVVALAAGSVVVRAKKLVVSVVKNLKSSFRRRRQVTRRVQVLSQKESS